MTAWAVPSTGIPPWLLAANNPSISGLIITVSEGFSRVQKYLRVRFGLLWLWRVQDGNVCGLILDSPCSTTWMVLGSPKGNQDPVGSLLVMPRESQVLQVVGGGGDGCFFLTHQSLNGYPVTQPSSKGVQTSTVTGWKKRVLDNTLKPHPLSPSARTRADHKSHS